MGFKRAPSTSKSSQAKKAKQDEPPRGRAATRRTEREAPATTRRRGRKRKSSENAEEDEEPVAGRRHEYSVDDDEENEGYEDQRGTRIGDILIPERYIRKPHEMSGERIIIQKVVCENFKSYGGIKEMGPFHKSYTAIVGPNGNGKSNIIDALLFVFGYRASKIRSKNLDLLIHKSELLPDVKTCAVTVHFVKVFDEGVDDQIREVPNSGITVMRRQIKEKGSKYLLNGEEVQFQEVAEFLNKSGIDIIHNRFLILQGEVESISQMPPKKNGKENGLLEFLEDVIGTKRYHKCLFQLEEKVDHLNFDRETKLHAVDIVEKEKRCLAEPVKKAKEFLRAKNTLNQDKHKLFQYKIFSTNEDIGTLEAEKKEAEDRLAETDQKLDKLNEENKDQEKKIKEKDDEVKAAAAEFKGLESELHKAENSFTKVKENLTRANTQRKKVIKDMEATEHELEELKKIPGNADKELKALQQRRDELDGYITKEEVTVNAAMEKVNSQVEKLSKEKEGLDKNFMDLKKVRDEKKEQTETLQSEIKVMKEQEETETRKLETMTKELEELKDKIKAREREGRSSMGNRVPVLEQNLQQKTGEFDTLKRREAQAKTDADSTRAAYDSAREVFESSQTNDNIYKAFWAEKDKGRFQGIYGRLRDLATIDEKYNVAATVASGLWDHWVVDTDATGTEAIKFLHEKNLPFQNFQCLNKLQRYLQSSRQAFRAPADSHRLFDLINLSKPEVAPAFYKALQDTLVTENLEIGSRIAYSPSRPRVATLAGEVIDPSGQMTGGGRQRIIGKLNGRMAASLNRSISEQDYRKLKQDMETAAKTYEDICTQRQAIEEEIRALRTSLRDINAKLDSSKSDVESMKNQLKLKERRLAEQEQKVKEAAVDPKLLRQKEKLAEKAEKEFQEASEPCAVAEAEAKKVEDKLKSLQTEKKKEIRRKLDGWIEQRQKVIDDFNKYSVSVKNYPKTLVKLENKLENLTEERERLQAEMLELDAKKKELVERTTQTAQRNKEMEEKIKTLKEEHKALKAATGEFGKQRSKLEKARVTLENEFKNVAGRYQAIAGRVNAYKAKMEELELAKIPEEPDAEFETLTPDALGDLDVEELKEKIAEAEEQLKKEKPNLGVLEQYNEKLKEFIEKVDQLDQITMERDKYTTAYTTAVANRLEEFMSGYAIISTKLKEMFRMISMGGDAELELIDSMDPFSYGIGITVRPAKKSWKKILNLSGGEKTLASLALIFALHHFKPSPFYVMDEIDAALDFKNVSIIANYIKDRTKFTQFIIISLRSNMFELADSMLGVYKVDNMSYSIHIGISRLLAQLRGEFRNAGRPFPLENEYLANNREERQKDMEKIVSSQKEKKNIFNADLSNISGFEETMPGEPENDDPSMSEAPMSEALTQKVPPPPDAAAESGEVDPLNGSGILTQRIDGEAAPPVQPEEDDLTINEENSVIDNTPATVKEEPVSFQEAFDDPEGEVEVTVVPGTPSAAESSEEEEEGDEEEVSGVADESEVIVPESPIAEADSVVPGSEDSESEREEVGESDEDDGASESE